MSTTTKYFNPIPLFILFREAIEASIVVAVLLTFLSRSSPQLKKQVWWGVAGGIGLSLICAGIFAGIFYVAQNNVFTGQKLLVFKGCMAWVACVFITYLAFAMLRYQGWEAKWERKLAAKGVKKMAEEEAKKANENPETAAEEGLPSPVKPAQPTSNPDPPTSGLSGHMRTAWAYVRAGWTFIVTDFALFWVVFFTVLREGMESIIFLFGVGNADPISIPISGLIGIFCGVMVGVVLYYTGKSVKDIKWLLWTFAVFLFFIAAGSAELGAESLMYAGMFGPYVLPQSAYTAPGVGSVSAALYGGDGQPPAPSAAGGAAASAFNDGDEIVVTGPVDLNDGYVYVLTPRQPWWQEPLWDISKCCAETDDKNRFLALANTIVGYNADPTFIDAIFYLGYWFVTLSIGLFKWYRGRLLDADWKHTAMMRALRKQQQDELALRAKTADAWSNSEVSSDQLKDTAAGPSSQPLVVLEVAQAPPEVAGGGNTAKA